MKKSFSGVMVMVVGGSFALWALFSACRVLTDADTSDAAGAHVRIDTAATGGSAFRTDADRYVAVVKEDPYRYVEVEIPMTFVNPMEKTVYLIGCRQPTMPILQKLEEGSWNLAYAPVELQCLSPPVPVRPGEAYRDTFFVHGAFPGQRIVPEFVTDVEGTYRLVRSIYADPEGEDVLPDSVRTSNTFELTSQSE